MNIYYLAGKLHTDQTITAARAYHKVVGERVIINDKPAGAIGVVMANRNVEGAYLAGRPKQGAQISITLPPRIYNNETHAWSAIAEAAIFDPAIFKVQYVHIAEDGS